MKQLTRRDFLETAATAAGALVAGSEAGCSSVRQRRVAAHYIRLFGVNLAVDNAGLIDLPIGWDYQDPGPDLGIGKFDRQALSVQIWRTFVQDRFVVDCRFTINVVESGGVYIPLTPQPLSGISERLCLFEDRYTAATNHRLNFAFGGLNLGNDDTDVSVQDVNGKTVISFNSINLWDGAGTTDLPIEIFGCKGSVTFDLTSRTIDFNDVVLQALVRANVGGKRVFARTLNLAHGNKIVYEKGNEKKSRASLSFDVPSNGIPLNCDFPDASATSDQLTAMCTIRNGTFSVALSHPKPAAPHQIEELAIGANATLQFQALSMLDDTAPTIELTSPIPLALRPTSTGVPASLILDPPSAGIEVTPLFPQPFSTPFGGTEYSVATSTKASLTSAARESSATVPVGVNARIAASLSGAYLRFYSGQFAHPRSGRQFGLDGSTFTSDLAYIFDRTTSRNGVAIPVLTPGHLARSVAVASSVVKTINKLNAGDSNELPLVRHDSLRSEITTTRSQPLVSLVQLLPQPLTGTVSRNEELVLADHQTTISFNAFSITVKVAQGDPLDYVVLHKSGAWSLNPPQFDVFPCGDTTSLATDFIATISQNDPNAGPIVGLIKLSRDLSLREIFEKETLPIAIADVDESLLTTAWTGVLFFDVPMTKLPKSLDALLGADEHAISIEYLALTPSAPSSNGPGFPKVAGLINWVNTAAPPAYDPTTSLEVSIVPCALFVRFSGSLLQTFRFKASISLDSLFGQGFDPHHSAKQFSLIGSYDSDAQRLRFVSTFQEPLDVLPDFATNGLFASCNLKAAEVVIQDNQTLVVLSGNVVLKSLDAATALHSWFTPVSANQIVQFSDLAILLDSTGIAFRYPILYGNLLFDLSSSHLTHATFPGLDVTLDRLEFRWGQTGIDNVGFIPLDGHAGGDDFKNGGFFITFRCVIAAMPVISELGIPQLVLRLRLGFPRNIGGGWDSSKVSAEIAFSGFENANGFDLDLFRILRIKAKTFSEKEILQPHYLSLVATGVELWLLNTPIASGLTFIIFIVPNAKKGLQLGALIYAESEQTNGWAINVPWVLVGKNIAFQDETVPNALLDLSDLVGSNDGLRGDKLAKAADVGNIFPTATNSTQPMPDWTVALGLEVLRPLFQGKFLYQDHGYIGVALRSTILDILFGYKFAISVLYVKGQTPSEDQFSVAFTVPSVTFPAFHFQGGVMQVTLSLDGGFVLDAGFPWLQSDGTRDWNRSFGAIVFPLQGSGGVYLAYRALTPSISVPAPSNLAPISGGCAVQFGFGASWGDGIFRVWGTVGLYAIVEGTFWLSKDGNASSRNTLVTGFELAGAVGILIRAVGELDWWILSIRIEVTAGAEARLLLQWGQPYEATQDANIVVKVSFTVYASVSASACIGPKYFQVCKGISVTVAMTVNQSIEMAI